jgi:hypothetical protein
MKAMQFHSMIGSDGLLNLRVELGPEEPATPVLVTIEPSPESASASTGREEWHRVVEETYGSCAGLGLERPPQLELEERDSIE